MCHSHAFLSQSSVSECVRFISKVHLNLFFHRQAPKTDDEALNDKINELVVGKRPPVKDDNI